MNGWWLLLSAAWSAPSEVGTVHPFGLGIAAGFPVSLTFKWMPDGRQGAAVHIGPTLVTTGLHTRVQYEARLKTLKIWDVADLGIGWHTGVLVNLVFGQAATDRAARIGVYAGATVDLRLVPAPVSVFAEVAPVIYPLDLIPGSRFLPAGINLAVGARWHFGTRRRPVPEGPVMPLDPMTPVEEPVAPPGEGEIGLYGLVD
jgi:hypothetical protein